MSFLDKIKSSRKIKNRIKNKIISLQAQNKSNKNAYTDIYYSHNSKRMSPIISCKIAGGVSVEAAMAVPVFIFFIVNLISVIGFFDEYSTELSRLQQSTRIQAYENNNIYSPGMDMITQTSNIDLNPLFSTIGFESSLASVGITYRKWTGYDISSSNTGMDDEEYVYVTEYGQSYHRNIECRHLKVTILIAYSEEIYKKRNHSGQKYYACERCGGNGTGVVFYTPEGNSFHSRSDCSSLKRTIITIPLSSVGGRSPCKSCG